MSALYTTFSIESIFKIPLQIGYLNLWDIFRFLLDNLE